MPSIKIELTESELSLIKNAAIHENKSHNQLSKDLLLNSLIDPINKLFLTYIDELRSIVITAEKIISGEPPNSIELDRFKLYLKYHNIHWETDKEQIAGICEVLEERLFLLMDSLKKENGAAEKKVLEEEKSFDVFAFRYE